VFKGCLFFEENHLSAEGPLLILTAPYSTASTLDVNSILMVDRAKAFTAASFTHSTQIGIKTTFEIRDCNNIQQSAEHKGYVQLCTASSLLASTRGSIPNRVLDV